MEYISSLKDIQMKFDDAIKLLDLLTKLIIETQKGSETYQSYNVNYKGFTETLEKASRKMMDSVSVETIVLEADLHLNQEEKKRLYNYCTYKFQEAKVGLTSAQDYVKKNKPKDNALLYDTYHNHFTGLFVTVEKQFRNDFQSELEKIVHGIFDEFEKDFERLDIPKTTKSASEDEEDDKLRTKKVVVDVLLKILKQAGINTAVADTVAISKLMNYLTGYSQHTIRQQMTNTEELTLYHKSEVEKVNKLLQGVKSSITVTNNSYR